MRKRRLFFLIIPLVLALQLSRGCFNHDTSRRYGIKATYLARAGAMKMLAELARDTNLYDSLNEDWCRDKDNPKVLSLRSDTVNYGASDENRRLNLNSGTLEKGHLTRLGIDSSVARNILEYKTKKGLEGFGFIEELFLVEGMTQEQYLLLKDSVTIYGGPDTRVNINTATERVLVAILGNPSLVRDILNYRKGPDGYEGTEDDGIFKGPDDLGIIEGLDPSLFTVSSTVFRIWAQSFFLEDKNIFKGVEAVVDRSGKVYHWKEY
ncbi:MAG: hypothetical protein V3S13_03470 [Candidatus Omnitrophota bacterium]